jgi:hypothetical protein
MRKRANLLLLLCLAAPCGVTVASGAPVQVTFGRDIRRLQDLVDRRYGKNHIDVTKDFIGARSGDIDPWFWVGDPISAVRVTVLRRSAGSDVVGWYEENGDGRQTPGGSVLFSGQVLPQVEAILTLPGFRTRFGFYVDATISTGVPGAQGPGPGGSSTKRFFTNRKLNDCGPDGTGAIHTPLDGDVQALTYDVSRWAGPDTWLVCFEDQDTGGTLVEGGRGYDGDDDAEGADDGRTTGMTSGKPKEVEDRLGYWRRSRGSNRDFCDVVFEVRAEGATPSHAITFGGLKLLYR